MSERVDTNDSSDRVPVSPADCHTFNLLQQLLPSVFVPSEAATIFLTHRSETSHPIRAAIVSHNETFSMRLKIPLIGPFRGATREEALLLLLHSVEEFGARKLETIETLAAMSADTVDDVNADKERDLVEGSGDVLIVDNPTSEGSQKLAKMEANIGVVEQHKDKGKSKSSSKSKQAQDDEHANKDTRPEPFTLEYKGLKRKATTEDNPSTPGPDFAEQETTLTRFARSVRSTKSKPNVPPEKQPVMVRECRYAESSRLGLGGQGSKTPVPPKQMWSTKVVKPPRKKDEILRGQKRDKRGEERKGKGFGVGGGGVGQ